jgi:hypothetical protein
MEASFTHLLFRDDASGIVLFQFHLDHALLLTCFLSNAQHSFTFGRFLRPAFPSSSSLRRFVNEHFARTPLAVCVCGVRSIKSSALPSRPRLKFSVEVQRRSKDPQMTKHAKTGAGESESFMPSDKDQQSAIGSSADTMVNPAAEVEIEESLRREEAAEERGVQRRHEVLKNMLLSKRQEILKEVEEDLGRALAEDQQRRLESAGDAGDQALMDLERERGISLMEMRNRRTHPAAGRNVRHLCGMRGRNQRETPPSASLRQAVRGVSIARGVAGKDRTGRRARGGLGEY